MSLTVKNLGGDVPFRFEIKVAKIRCLFRFLGYFGGRLATFRRSVPHPKIRGDAPAGVHGRSDVPSSLYSGVQSRQVTGA